MQHDDQRRDGAEQREGVQRAIERETEDQRDGDAQRALHVYGDVRGLELGMHLGQRRGQDAHAAQREADPASRRWRPRWSWRTRC